MINPSGWLETVRHTVSALAPHGPTPIVAVVIGGLGLLALILGASPEAVVPIVVLSFLVYIWGQERSAKWRRDALRAEFDALQQNEGRDVQRRLTRRLELNRKRDQPSLFDEKGGSRDRAE